MDGNAEERCREDYLFSGAPPRRRGWKRQLLAEAV
jgi:hypothetical protein